MTAGRWCNILETFPRDELFQISDDQLLDVALGILDLQQRPRVALFLRRDDFDRFVSCLVYVPRDRYTTQLRLAIQAILAPRLRRANSRPTTRRSTDAAARPPAVRRRAPRPGAMPDVDADELEAEIVEASRGWPDHLAGRARRRRSARRRAPRAAARYGRAFPPGYRERSPPPAAVRRHRAASSALSPRAA